VPEANSISESYRITPNTLRGGRQCDMVKRVTWSRRKAARAVLPSDLGFLGVAGREPGIPLRQAFLKFRDLISSDMDWSDLRKARFRASATYIKTGVLVLTATSTIVLGISAIPSRAVVALPMVAFVTVLGGLEGFHNWRSRWILMEECQYRLNRLRDKIDYYLILTPEADLQRKYLDEFFAEQQEIWADTSQRWIEFRKLERSSDGGDVTRQINAT
jgi:hypothetical protein